MLTVIALGVLAAKLSAFTCNPFGAQRDDFDCMAWFGHIAARFEGNFLIFVIATRPYFLGHRLLAHLRKREINKDSNLLTKGNEAYWSSFSIG